MKTQNLERQFFHLKPINHYLCLEKLKSCLPSPLLLWLRSLQTVTWLPIRQSAAEYVRLVIRGGLSALASVTKAKLFGYVLLVVGGMTIYAHQLFFSEAARDYDWIYLNWYYYFFTNRMFIVMILWSAGFLALVPPAKNLAVIPASLFQSFGWIGLIHNSFFVQTNEQFTEWPHWSVWVMGVSFSIAVILTVKYQLYWWNHKVRGNHARFVGVAELPLTPDEKEKMYKLLAKEYRDVQKMI
jgi:hypothetical protein